MWFHALLDCLKPHRSRLPVQQGRREDARRRPNARRLVVETLEDRRLLTAMFSVGDAVIVEGDAGTQYAEVLVRLTEPHGNTVTVNYRTADGTASAGSDYDTVSGKLTFAKNQTSKTILVPVRGDSVLEADESFSVQLFNAKGAKIADGTGAITILDDEPRLSISDVSDSEGNDGTKSFEFIVSLSSAHNEVVTVEFATADGSATAGSDYIAKSGTLNFGVNETSQTITVDVIGDRLPEPNKTFFVILSNSNGEITRSVGYGTINDDEPRISISDAWNYGESTFTFYVSLSVPYDEVVTVDFATVDVTALAGVNYEATSGTLTFIPGEATTQMIVVQVLTPPPYDEYFLVHLSNASNNALIANEWAGGYWYYDCGCYGWPDDGWYNNNYYGY
jgi:hypothetical protein